MVIGTRVNGAKIGKKATVSKVGLMGELTRGIGVMSQRKEKDDWLQNMVTSSQACSMRVTGLVRQDVVVEKTRFLLIGHCC